MPDSLQPEANTSNNTLWYQTGWAWFWLIVFWPAGLYAFWMREGAGKKVMQVLMGCFVAAYITMLVAGLFSDTGSDEGVKTLVWSEEFNMGISQAIIKQGISGCGQYKWAKVSGRQYEVSCTSDGRRWITHTVYAN